MKRFDTLHTVTDYNWTNSTTRNDIFEIPSNFHQYTTFRLVVTRVLYSSASISILQFSLKQISLSGYPINAAATAIATATDANAVSKLLCAGPSSFLGNTLIQGEVTIKNSTIATNTASGAFVVKGDAGITGNAYISQLTVDKNAVISGNLTVNGNISISQNFQFNQMSITGSIPATSITTGALIIPSGGAAISGNIHIGNQLFVR